MTTQGESILGTLLILVDVLAFYDTADEDLLVMVLDMCIPDPEGEERVADFPETSANLWRYPRSRTPTRETTLPTASFFNAYLNTALLSESIQCILAIFDGRLVVLHRRLRALVPELCLCRS